jgi:hypothetical protein
VSDVRALEALCRDTYARAETLWHAHRDDQTFATARCGFSTIYAPPRPRPQLFFVGINPGFLAGDSFTPGAPWPERNEYAFESYKLARVLQSLFRAAGLTEVLEASNGCNLNFFKSANVGKDQPMDWLHNPPALRKILEHHSRIACDALIDAFQPSFLMMLGIGLFEQLAADATLKERGPTGRRMILSGTYRGHPALGLAHPSGSIGVTAEDWAVAAHALPHLLNSIE